MKKKESFSNFLSKYGILCVFILMFILFSVYAPNFLKLKNIFNVSRQIATLGICAVGMTMVLICGGTDLSMGYQISLANVVCASLMVKAGWGILPSVLVVLVMGTFIGFLNGVIIVKSGVAPLIVTLATMNILKGFSYMVSKGLPVYGFPKGFSTLGQGNIFGTIPIPLVVMIVVFIIGAFILKKVYIGRYFYAVGSNEEAAKLSGINTLKVRIIAHTLCGFLTAIGAVLLLSRVNSGLTANGAGFEFNVITACVLGGVSASGGKGTIFGALTGCLIVGFLENGLLLMNISEYTQMVIQGALLLVAVCYDSAMLRRNERVKKVKAINVNNEV
jgi:ribose transport system permease protein